MEPIKPIPKKFSQQFEISGIRHFTAKEVWKLGDKVRKDERGREVRAGYPHACIQARIFDTLIILDELREVIGVPVTLLSGFLCAEYNRLCGGVRDSQHLHFRALDFTFDASEKELEGTAEMLLSWQGRKFPRLPYSWFGGVGLYRKSRFIHVDCRGTTASWEG